MVGLAASANAAVRVPATKDNSIVLYPREYHLNAGDRQRIRIKGNQHLVAMDFDWSAVRGKLVRAATLVCTRAEHDIAGVTVSTIQAPWDEHRSCALTSGVGSVEGWGRRGAFFPAVTGGNAFSLVSQAPSLLRDGAYHWQLHPDLVHACAIGASHGLTLHEFECDYSRNPTIWSREAGGRSPCLLLEFGGTEPPPRPPTGLQMADGGDPDSLRLRLQAPASGFTYEVIVNGVPLPRWNTPFVAPGSPQVIPIRDLALSAVGEAVIEVRTLDRLGRRSRPAAIRAAIPQRAYTPLPEPAALPPPATPPSDLAAIPVTDRYDAGGRPVGALPEGYRTSNSLFDGRTIRLAAAKGEVVGFQVLANGQGPVGVDCEMPGMRTDVFRALYVQGDGRRIPDPLLPADSVALSPREATPLVVDVYVPFDARPGLVEGEFRLSDGRVLPVNLTVRDFALPRRASFLCEMNSYGLPNHVDTFYRLQEVAYDHRVHCNILHYAHRTAAPGARKCNMDMVLPGGRRMDERRYNDIAPGARGGYWDDFIAAFGPYLSGQHFRNGHRGPVPAPGFYLTFHESWPLNCRAYFGSDPDAYEAFRDSPAYSQTFMNVMRDFAAVAARQGWTETGFQVYLNNKGSLNDPQRAPWVLDEPAAYWDYRALAYYADLTAAALGSEPVVKIDYRVDISRPQFDRGQLWGKADLWVVAMGAFKRYPRLVADRRELTGENVWVYGTSSRVEESSRNIMAWVLEAYRGGAVGLVPWQTINRDGSALRRADQLGLFILDGSGGGEPAVRHTMRLKAYRRAQQDVEYLGLLRRRLGWTDRQMRDFINHYVDLDGRVARAGAEDAGTAGYDRLSPEGFRRLREAGAMLLEGAGGRTEGRKTGFVGPLLLIGASLPSRMNDTDWSVLLGL
jgi:hypothetical protein